jgi:hypothetical protein
MSEEDYTMMMLYYWLGAEYAVCNDPFASFYEE